jgi:hypothetical protein
LYFYAVLTTGTLLVFGINRHVLRVRFFLIRALTNIVVSTYVFVGVRGGAVA